ncbi:hypothetical protein L226DRAFT_391525 [Lentinus tigrinus ALCF2SS1-7]|uniref:uncharacterized protein n=1 Tax=Lentinus tigrinus ALCF2SS1-7 TaxID=1328758 RepID=UPI0011663A9F|nr:hypothetical protein L226DRAFT_391525 [Lentinus tigrinus ALCF2SS1-7]
MYAASPLCSSCSDAFHLSSIAVPQELEGLIAERTGKTHVHILVPPDKRSQMRPRASTRGRRTRRRPTILSTILCVVQVRLDDIIPSRTQRCTGIIACPSSCHCQHTSLMIPRWTRRMHYSRRRRWRASDYAMPAYPTFYSCPLSPCIYYPYPVPVVARIFRGENTAESQIY